MAGSPIPLDAAVPATRQAGTDASPTNRARAALREHRALLAVVAVFVGVSAAIAATTGHAALLQHIGFRPSFNYFVKFLLIPLPFAFIWCRLTARDAAGRFRPGLPGWRQGARRFVIDYADPPRIAGAALAGILAALTINVFGSWKANIPRVQPFAWDVRFTELDRVLHLGRLPWEWLHGLLGRPEISYTLDIVYYTWLPLLAIVVAWQAWTPLRAVRARFLVSFVLVWILLGTVAATLLSSAGPCYFALLNPGPDPYGPLLAYLDGLEAQGLMRTRTVQGYLWQLYQTGQTTPYTGISAMPSIHVAMPVLYTLTTWRRHKGLALLFAAYGFVILIGSVHLGWHYAVDGYLSIAGVCAIWWLAGKLVRSDA